MRRTSTLPAILHHGFRPFFFLAALHAGIYLPLWLWFYFLGEAPPGPFSGPAWHAHEMLFGYLSAVMAGFVLTAIPNWTGRLPLSGWPLAGLVALWIAGRIATAWIASPIAALLIDITFPSALAFMVWREIIAGRNWKNAPIATLITLFGLAGAIDHAANLELAAEGIGRRMALAVVVVLLAFVGGRIVPSFTHNWLVKTGATRLPSSFGGLDRIALMATVLAAAAWSGLPASPLVGILLSLAGALLAARLARWRGYLVMANPIVLVLHVGYAWLAIALFLLGAAMLLDVVPESAALHALTAGAIGTMTLAVMTRASLGHTGRAIVADRAMTAIYAAATIGALLRVAAPMTANWHAQLLVTGGALWSAAFLLFAIRFAPVLWRRRVGA